MKLSHAVVLAAAGAWAVTAQADTSEKWAVSAEGGYQMLNNATDSAKAVFDGSTGGAVFGGSLRVSLTRSFFAGAGLLLAELEVFQSRPIAPTRDDTLEARRLDFELASLVAYVLLGWTVRASLITGTAPTGARRR